MGGAFIASLPQNGPMENHIVRKSIDINANPADVWDALINPEKTKQYFFHCEVASDWRVGSPIRFKGKLFLIKSIEMTGEILQIEPRRILKYTLRNDSDENGSFSTVTDELEYAHGITTLTITDDVGGGEGAQERYEQSMKGWDKVLSGLKELVEKQD